MRSCEKWLTVGKQPGLGHMGHWLLQLLLSGAVHSGTIGSGCLPPRRLVGWREEAGGAEKRQTRD